MSFRAQGREASWNVFALPEVLFTLKCPGLGWREWETWQSLSGRLCLEGSETPKAWVPWGRNSGRAGKWAALLPKVLEAGYGSLTMPSQLIGAASSSVESEMRVKKQGS